MTFTQATAPPKTYNRPFQKPAIPLRILTVRRVIQTWNSRTGSFEESPVDGAPTLQHYNGTEWVDVPAVIVEEVEA